jgi:hypothetical protein
MSHLANRAMTKQQITAEIRRTADANGGVPLGRERFERETGIKESFWSGKFWASWGDAVREAGFPVNPWNAAYPEEHLLAKYARLVRELGRVPTIPQMRMKRRADSTFPNDKVFGRFGDKLALLKRVRKFCEDHSEFRDVLDIVSSEAPKGVSIQSRKIAPVGFVYLTKFGRHFKIGRTNAVGRRERELAIQLFPTSIVVGTSSVFSCLGRRIVEHEVEHPRRSRRGRPTEVRFNPTGRERHRRVRQAGDGGTRIWQTERSGVRSWPERFACWRCSLSTRGFIRCGTDQRSAGSVAEWSEEFG